MPVAQLYQLGNLPLHLHSLPAFEGAYKTSAKSVDLLWAAQTYQPNRQFLSETRDVTIDGILLNTCALTAQETFTRLQHMIGRGIDVIAYIDLNCCNDIGESCCACSGGSSCRLLWVQSRGMIKGADPKRHDNLGREVVDVTITLEHSGYWSPVNRFFWNWGEAGGFTFPIAQSVPDPYPITALPVCDEIFCRNCPCSAFHKKFYDDAVIGWDPEVWVNSHCGLAPFYPTTGYAESWSTTYPRQQLLIDPDLWSAPPMSIYAFKNLPVTGTIEIEVLRTEGLWGGIRETTTLDLAQLDSDLFDGGYTGLLPTDIVYIGDVLKSPGFVLRGDTIIDYPRPLPDYPGPWPGYVTPGFVQIDFNIPSGVEFAYLHEMRRL